MRADAIRMLLATVDTMHSATYADPQSRKIHPTDLPALLGVSVQEAQLTLDEATNAGFLGISGSGALFLTGLGRKELAQSTLEDALVPDLACLGMDI